MKKLRVVVTSVIILAIVSSAFAYKAKKIGKFCYADTYTGWCQVSTDNLKRVPVGTPGSVKRYYAVDWDGDQFVCDFFASCTVASGFMTD